MGLPQHSTEKIYKKMTLLSGTKVGIRPWTVGDKKNFLIQLEFAGGDKLEIKRIMLNLIENCLEDRTQIKELSSNDITQLLAELKKHAEGDMIDFAVNCPHCKTRNKDIQLSITKDVKAKGFDLSPISISDKFSVVVRDVPELVRIDLLERFADSEVKFNFYFLVASISAIMEGDEIYSNFTEEEMMTWLDGIDDFSIFEKLTKELKKHRSSFEISKDINCQSCEKKINVYFNEPERFFVL